MGEVGNGGGRKIREWNCGKGVGIMLKRCMSCGERRSWRKETKTERERERLRERERERNALRKGIGEEERAEHREGRRETVLEQQK